MAQATNSPVMTDAAGDAAGAGMTAINNVYGLYSRTYAYKTMMTQTPTYLLLLMLYGTTPTIAKPAARLL